MNTKKPLHKKWFLPITTRNGFEPSTSAVTGRRSNQLSHRAIKQHIQEITLAVIHHFNQTHWISPRPISSCQLNALQHLHLSPIYLVLFKGSYSCDGISHLEVGFTLRCLQRLSIPNLPTLRWDWFPTGSAEVSPSRSSRTKDRSSQISYARAG